MLKTDLHIHTSSDPYDNINYNDYDIIDRAAKLGFDVISITNHNKVTFNRKLEKYARQKNILLIPGVEKTLNGKHVLIYNITQEQCNRITDFKDLKKLDNAMVIAPHPYFIYPVCLGNLLVKYINCFDAIEYSFFFTKFINLNKKAQKIAKKYKKAMIATSDLHSIKRFGKFYSLIDADKNFADIKKAIIENKVKNITQGISTSEMIITAIRGVIMKRP